MRITHRIAVAVVMTGLGFSLLPTGCDLSERERREFDGGGNGGPTVGAGMGKDTLQASGSGGSGGDDGAGGSGGDGGAGGVSSCDQSGTCDACLQCTYFGLCSNLQIACNNDSNCVQALNCMRNCGTNCAFEGSCYQDCRQQNCSLLPGFFDARSMLDCVCRDNCATDCTIERQADCTLLLP